MEYKKTIIEHLLRFFNLQRKWTKEDILRCLPKRYRKKKQVIDAFQELIDEKILVSGRFKKQRVYRLNPKRIKELRKVL